MNKETRRFIVGVAICIIGIIGMGAVLIQFKNGEYDSVWDYIILITSLYNAYKGGIIIKEVI